MAFHQRIIVPPRPVALPDLGDTRWRRFVDAILFRRGLRQHLSMARDELYATYLEVERANDRRTEGASAAHEGMFKIESLGIIESTVTIRNEERRMERVAEVRVCSMDNKLIGLNYERTVVAFQGQSYILDQINAHDRMGFGDYQTVDLTLRGIML